MLTNVVRPVVLSLGVAAAAPASAAQQLEPPFVLGKYYEQNGVSACDTFKCALVFSKVPAGKTLIVERVACALTTLPDPMDSVFLTVFRSPSDTFNRVEPMTVSLSGTRIIFEDTRHYYASNHETHFPMFGSSPSVEAIKVDSPPNSDMTVRCKIAGTLSP
jgi:hypothetical protein